MALSRKELETITSQYFLNTMADNIYQSASFMSFWFPIQERMWKALKERNFEVIFALLEMSRKRSSE